MQNQMHQQDMHQSTNYQAKMNHGGHEMFDAHEIISGTISLLNQYQMYDQFMKDQELKTILQRQYTFINDLYNLMVQAFSTGEDPSHRTQAYEMQLSHDIVYGLTPSQPKKPNQSINELGEQCLSSFMLGQCKSMAGLLGMAACEITNPVLRRVVAASVPNFVEMAYELFLYQNKHQYYQVPQLQQQDMTQMVNSFTITKASSINQQPPMYM
ncbi:spore coat protein [Metabacillus rhizolycopersici]|nr:spore coat protein [Metabacillus rhizolycopersici]